MADQKVLQFKVKDEVTGKWRPPRWREIETEGDKCPKDGTTMVVVSAGNKPLYAYCIRCQKVYLGE